MIDQTAFAAGAAYLHGRYRPIHAAGISLLDWGFTRSDLTYDVVHVRHGAFFRLADHLERFARGIDRLRLRIPESQDEIARILHHCVALAGLEDAYVAMVASRGRPMVPGSRRPADCQNHLVAYAVPWVDVIHPDVQERGAHVHIASVPRIPDDSNDPTVKNYQWGDLTRGLLEAEDAGCDTAVLLDRDGFLTEGPGFNICLIRDGVLTTPDRGALHGITRRSVLELCAELGIPAEVAPVPASALEEVDEVLLCTTAGGIMPVARIGGRILGNDAPGPLSRRLKERYWQKHREGWHATPIDYASLPAAALIG